MAGGTAVRFLFSCLELTLFSVSMSLRLEEVQHGCGQNAAAHPICNGNVLQRSLVACRYARCYNPATFLAVRDYAMTWYQVSVMCSLACMLLAPRAWQRGWWWRSALAIRLGTISLHLVQLLVLGPKYVDHLSTWVHSLGKARMGMAFLGYWGALSMSVPLNVHMWAGAVEAVLAVCVTGVSDIGTHGSVQLTVRQVLVIVAIIYVLPMCCIYLQQPAHSQPSPRRAAASSSGSRSGGSCQPASDDASGSSSGKKLGQESSSSSSKLALEYASSSSVTSSKSGWGIRQRYQQQLHSPLRRLGSSHDELQALRQPCGSPRSQDALLDSNSSHTGSSMLASVDDRSPPLPGGASPATLMAAGQAALPAGPVAAATAAVGGAQAPGAASLGLSSSAAGTAAAVAAAHDTLASSASRDSYATTATQQATPGLAMRHTPSTAAAHALCPFAGLTPPGSALRASSLARTRVPGASLTYQGKTRTQAMSIKVYSHPGSYEQYAAALTAAAVSQLSASLQQQYGHEGGGRPWLVQAACVRGCVQLFVWVTTAAAGAAARLPGGGDSGSAMVTSRARQGPRAPASEVAASTATAAAAADMGRGRAEPTRSISMPAESSAGELWPAVPVMEAVGEDSSSYGTATDALGSTAASAGPQAELGNSGRQGASSGGFAGSSAGAENLAQLVSAAARGQKSPFAASKEPASWDTATTVRRNPSSGGWMDDTAMYSWQPNMGASSQCSDLPGTGSWYVTAGDGTGAALFSHVAMLGASPPGASSLLASSMLLANGLPDAHLLGPVDVQCLYKSVDGSSGSSNSSAASSISSSTSSSPVVRVSPAVDAWASHANASSSDMAALLPSEAVGWMSDDPSAAGSAPGDQIQLQWVEPPVLAIEELLEAKLGGSAGASDMSAAATTANTCEVLIHTRAASAAVVRVLLLGSAGQVVYEQQHDVVAGQGTIRLDGSQLQLSAVLATTVLQLVLTPPLAPHPKGSTDPAPSTLVHACMPLLVLPAAAATEMDALWQDMVQQVRDLGNEPNGFAQPASCLDLPAACAAAESAAAQRADSPFWQQQAEAQVAEAAWRQHFEPLVSDVAFLLSSSDSAAASLRGAASLQHSADTADLALQVAEGLQSFFGQLGLQALMELVGQQAEGWLAQGASYGEEVPLEFLLQEQGVDLEAYCSASSMQLGEGLVDVTPCSDVPCGELPCSERPCSELPCSEPPYSELAGKHTTGRASFSPASSVPTVAAAGTVIAPAAAVAFPLATPSAGRRFSA